MKLNPLVLFGLAGALGLAAFLATQQHLAAKTEEPKVAVLVARTEIGVGDPVTEANSALKEIFVSALPPRPITKPEQWQGKFAGSRFTAGEVIVQDKVAAKFGSDSRKIPPGMLVQTINVDRAKSHAGLLTPGDRVDVFGSFDISETDDRTGRLRKYQMIKRVIGDLEVWSVGSHVVGAEQGGGREEEKDTARRATSTIGLLATPEQYAKLAGAEAAGNLFLGLRHPDDESDPGEISFVSKDLYEAPADQQRRAANEVEPPAVEDAGGLGAFLDREIAAATAPAASAAAEVPTWTVALHVGGQSRLSEVVDVAAARAAGFTAAQIAEKRRALQDPGASAPTEPRFAARPAAEPAPPVPVPFTPPTPAADGAPDADLTLNPSPAAGGVRDDGMYSDPE
ncbi:Flp pilus assembly protein CpaB [Alienimonas sp. DA493]|uniref:Flp pilus assembly protein CpaB n=1 Tax=Alienimonas sp. DA493 TaxID=3373605 RepID=UPI003754AE2A